MVLRGDLGPDPLAGQAVADEDHLAVGRPGHAATAGGDGAHLELQEIVLGRRALRCRLRWRRVGQGGHAAERRASRLDKISGRECRSGRSPIVVRSDTTNPNQEDTMRYLLMIALDESASSRTPEEDGRGR